MDALHDITIKSFRQQDKEACMMAFRSNIPAYFTEEELTDFEVFLHNVANHLPTKTPVEETYYFVMYKEDTFIGCGGYGYSTETQIVVFAWGLVYRPYHKMGFGKTLFDYRLKHMQAKYPCAKIVLDTTQHTFGFFEKYGFKVVKITADFYGPGLNRYDMLFHGEDPGNL